MIECTYFSQNNAKKSWKIVAFHNSGHNNKSNKYNTRCQPPIVTTWSLLKSKWFSLKPYTIFGFLWRIDEESADQVKELEIVGMHEFKRRHDQMVEVA